MRGKGQRSNPAFPKQGIHFPCNSQERQEGVGAHPNNHSILLLRNEPIIGSKMDSMVAL